MPLHPVVIGDVQGLDEESVRVGGIDPLRHPMEIVGQLVRLPHLEDPVPEGGEGDPAHIHRMLPLRGPHLLERVVVPEPLQGAFAGRLVPLDLGPVG